MPAEAGTTNPCIPHDAAPPIDRPESGSSSFLAVSFHVAILAELKTMSTSIPDTENRYFPACIQFKRTGTLESRAMAFICILESAGFQPLFDCVDVKPVLAFAQPYNRDFPRTNEFI